jgi:error-prone DNA polymerase
MIRKADTLGVFQIESRAQMAMLPRIKPRTFYDLVIEVAIVRPGPIQGDMVHPYLRRREGKERVDYPRPELERVLGKTLGVPLFQEQAMRVAIECAGFTPSEADQLRRAMATFKFTGGVSKFKEKLVGGMVERGYGREFAERTFSQLEGFGSYGFPESHAASFALIAYASSWMKCHHPDVFCAALLNAQPMGFYAPAQIVRDTREHGVEVRPVCVNASRWDCTLEDASNGTLAVRLGMRLVQGLANADVARIVAARADRPFADVDDVWRRSQVQVASLDRLAEADAFRPSLGLARRQAMWAIKALRDAPLPLFLAAEQRAQARISETDEPKVDLKPMAAGREVVEDYRHLSLTLRAHPVSFIRESLTGRGIVSCAGAMAARNGRRLTTAGLVLVRQMPASAKGVLFVTIEDETGAANLVIWPDLFERQRRVVLGAHLVAVKGRIQREGEVVHLIAERLDDLADDLASIGNREAPLVLPAGRADEVRRGSTPVPREHPAVWPRDMFSPDLSLEAIKLKPRNFR